jgi:hypothetical protein
VVDIQEIASTPWAARPDLLGRAAWSPNDRYLAFSDVDGLWLWDIHSGKTPTLLQASGPDGLVPLVGQFSPLGSYLGFSLGDQAFNLDLMTGDLLPGGIFSADEQNLAARGTQNGHSVMEIYNQIPRLNLVTRGCYRGLELPGGQPVWYQGQLICPSYIQVWDDEAMKYVYFYALDLNSRNGTYRTEVFAYDEHSQQLAIMLHEQNDLLIIDPTKREVRLNLGEQLDGPVLGLHWVPSVMFNSPELSR